MKLNKIKWLGCAWLIFQLHPTDSVGAVDPYAGKIEACERGWIKAQSYCAKYPTGPVNHNPQQWCLDSCKTEYNKCNTENGTQSYDPRCSVIKYCRGPANAFGYNSGGMGGDGRKVMVGDPGNFTREGCKEYRDLPTP